jgi:hypothetical protein
VVPKDSAWPAAAAVPRADVQQHREPAVTDQLATNLGTVDPADASTFTANASAFNTKIDELIAKLDALGDESPSRSRCPST